MTGRRPRRPDAALAVPDHNVPTSDRSKAIADEESRTQVETLERNAAEYGIPIFKMDDRRQGIVHIIVPEQHYPPPGTTSIRGDIQPPTHDAFTHSASYFGTRHDATLR